MSQQNTPPLKNAMDDPFDNTLRQHFQRLAEPDDDGFSERVITALPARASRSRVRWVAWVERAQLTAISLAACALAVLTSITDERVSVAHNIAAYALIGLLIFWSIPSRWSRG
jgi:hypothetical protein